VTGAPVGNLVIENRVFTSARLGLGVRCCIVLIGQNGLQDGGASAEPEIWRELALYKQLMSCLFILYDFFNLMIQGMKPGRQNSRL
jgi:hypothetical protein